MQQLRAATAFFVVVVSLPPDGPVRDVTLP